MVKNLESSPTNYKAKGPRTMAETFVRQPYAYGRWPCISFTVRRTEAACYLRPANCVHFMNLSRRNAAFESEKSRGSLFVIRSS